MVEGQWSNDPSVNTTVVETTSSNVLPKVATCLNGDSYISWFSAGADLNFHVLLQLYDKNGYRKWTNDLVVSDHPTMTWVSDYNMIVDDEGNAVLVNQDLRSGSSNVYAWRISSAGEFLWGADGKTITQDTGMANVSPKVVKTTSGDFIVKWEKSPADSANPLKSTIGLQRISKEGNLLWGNGVFIADTNNNYLADIISTEDSSIIVAWDNSKYFTADTAIGEQHYLHIYAQKYDLNGNPVWAGAVQVDTANFLEVGNYILPTLENDGSGGAFILWKSLYQFTVTNLVQHLEANGNAKWPGHGREVSDKNENSHSDGSMDYVSATGEFFVVWTEYHYDGANHTDCWGIYGQKFSSQGKRLWGNSGKAIIPLNCSPDSVYLLPVLKDAAAHNLGVFYEKEYLKINYPDTIIMNQIFATCIDSLGNKVWNDKIKLISNSAFDEAFICVADSSQGQWILSWSYMRNDNTRTGISVQNVTMDGQLGSLVIQESDSFINAPEFRIFPNPVEQSATICYKLEVPTHISISLFDSKGLFVNRICEKNEPSGEHMAPFTRKDYAPGVYLLKMETSKTTQYLKMILL
jgi:hypothetical protein